MEILCEWGLQKAPERPRHVFDGQNFGADLAVATDWPCSALKKLKHGDFSRTGTRRLARSRAGAGPAQNFAAIPTQATISFFPK